jgi:hypothetical protein
MDRAQAKPDRLHSPFHVRFSHLLTHVVRGDYRRTWSDNTHIATTLGIQAIQHHEKHIRLFTTVELVNAPEQEKAQREVGQLGSRLVHPDLATHEPGYIAFGTSGGLCCSICSANASDPASGVFERLPDL